jgi:acetoin utilization deacetylase AcuC-like enzyme
VKAYYSDTFELPLPEGHGFPMAKYRLLRERVETTGLIPPEDLRIPEPANAHMLARAHCPDYIRTVLEGRLTRREQNRIGFPWSPQMVERSCRSVGATLSAVMDCLDDGVAANLAGGTHHAHYARGEGYCVFNDAAVAAREAQHRGLVHRVLIVDLDVHQGNGTASITRGDTSIFTFSVHGASNFPARKESSDLDIALPNDTPDGPYLQAVEKGLNQALEQSRPDLVIYLAGADPYAGDRLGLLAVSKAGLAARDRLVFERCRALGLPVALAMAGGYAENVADIVDIHWQTLEAAGSLASPPPPAHRQRLNAI